MVCLLNGCTTYYYNPCIPYEECQYDWQQCFCELRKLSSLQEFGDYERSFMIDCMKQKGYRLTTEDKLPMRAKRQEPETSFDWRLNGLAGPLAEEMPYHYQACILCTQ